MISLVRGGRYYIFLWNDDKPKKLIHYLPEYPISIMSSCEGERNKFSALLMNKSYNASMNFANNPNINNGNEYIYTRVDERFFRDISTNY